MRKMQGETHLFKKPLQNVFLDLREFL